MTNLDFLALAQPSGAAEGGGSALGLPLMMLMLFVVMWFFMIRPQKKQADKRKAMLEALKRGDRIVTNGGLYGVIKDVKQDRFIVTIADGVKIELAKGGVADVISDES